MKMTLRCLVLTLFLFLGLHSVKNAVIKEGPVEWLRNSLEKECIKNANDGASAYAQLELSIIQFPTCLENSRRASTMEELFNDTCSERKSYACVEDVTEKAYPCFDTEAKYLINLGLSTYNKTMDYLCTNTVESFTEKMLNLRRSAASCTTDLKDYFTMAGNPCLHDVFKIINGTDFSVDCTVLEKIRTCMVKGLRKICKDEMVPEFVNGCLQINLNMCYEITKKLQNDSIIVRP